MKEEQDHTLNLQNLTLMDVQVTLNNPSLKDDELNFYLFHWFDKRFVKFRKFIF